jgi:hypothetical protein
LAEETGIPRETHRPCINATNFDDVNRWFYCRSLSFLSLLTLTAKILITFRIECSKCKKTVNYIVAASLIGGGNRNTQRNPPTCRKSLTITLMLYRVHLAAMSGIRTTFTIRSRPRRSGPHLKGARY